jgi:hypothetical protein
VCREWRSNVAHDLKNVDPVTNVPLAVKVCYNVAGLQFSFQASKFKDIGDYQSSGAGPLLSALCAFMWLTKVRSVGIGRCACGLRAAVTFAGWIRRSCTR